jgi:hypothetical protein
MIFPFGLTSKLYEESGMRFIEKTGVTVVDPLARPA